MLKFKYMDKYGKMFYELANKIEEDLKTKTMEELETIKEESNNCTSSNCIWVEYRISETVNELADWEIMKRNNIK